MDHDKLGRPEHSAEQSKTATAEEAKKPHPKHKPRSTQHDLSAAADVSDGFRFCTLNSSLNRLLK